MKVVSVAQMRELDRRTIEEFGTPGEILMERAGLGVAEAVVRLAGLCGWSDPAVLLVAGRGNNGGDAFTAARHLVEMGLDAEVWLAATADQVSGDALKHFEQIQAAGVPLRELPAAEDWKNAPIVGGEGVVLVDGLLGTGSTGAPREPVASAIRYINEGAHRSLVVSIDIPSGLNGDTGEAAGDVVEADLTVTMGLPKQGLAAQAALPCVGPVEVVDIGIPDECVEQAEPSSGPELICAGDLRALFPRRARVSHKGTYGEILLIGGARGYTGAISMAAETAVRSGAGLVHVLVPKSIAPIVAGAVLEAMVTGGDETDQGSLSADAWVDLHGKLNDYDAVLVGPGITRHQDILSLLRNIIRESTVPLVVDADAISVFAGNPGWIARASCPVALTPHPGELSRLLGQSVENIQRDRVASAMSAAEATEAIVLLKGAGTIVAEQGRQTCINLTGNPGMATGGSGDVLAGLLVGLLGQGLAAFDAACAAVYLHGRAGDRAAWQASQAGLAARDIIEEIPYAIREIAPR